mgnify:FL=1
MRISVAMATYNGHKYIVEQLDSIRNQSLKVDEVVICDDQSSDDTVSIIRNYIEKYKLDNWKVTVNKKNLGYADNFFKAMNETSGNYIFLSDQDDIWLEDKVEKMVDVLEKNPKVIVLGSDFEPYYCTQDAPKISAQAMKTMKYNDELQHVGFSSHNIFIGSEGCTMAIRREILGLTKQYWFSGWAHDEYLWKMAMCFDGMYIYHRKTMLRRLHSNNASKKKMHEIGKRVDFLKKLKISHERTLDCAKDKDLNTEIIKLLNKNIKSVALRIDLLEKRKIFNTIPLIFGYINNYHSKKSIPVEFLMAVRGK